MGYVMTASEFVNKLEDVAKNYKTLYVMGCFGSPMTSKNKTRYCNNHDYNKQAKRTKMIKTATTDTFGFDCVNLIKAILWGWNGDKTKTYGGAKYNTNGVPDVNADGMIKKCLEVSTDFSNVKVGELLWCKGHVGIYIGNGLAVECTPAWKNKVQITAVRNIGTKSGYNARTWTKHGKLPYIEYQFKNSTNVDAAEKFDKELSGEYKVIASGLHIRTGSGTANKSLAVLKKNTIVNNYGYYSLAANGAKWLYVKTSEGLVGYCSAKYLKKS